MQEEEEKTEEEGQKEHEEIEDEFDGEEIRALQRRRARCGHGASPHTSRREQVHGQH